MLFVWILVLHFLQAYSVYVLYHYELTKLYFTEDPSISWTISPTRYPATTICAGTPIMGGYRTFYDQQYISKSFDNIPTHSNIKTKMTLYILDNWYYESFIVYHDNQKVITGMYANSFFLENICGNTDKDNIDHSWEQTSQHTSNSFNLKIYSNISNSNSGSILSWGIREIQILIDTPCMPLCISCSGSVCDKLVLFAFQDQGSYQTSCKPGFYNNVADNMCDLCHYSCKTCQGYGSSNCSSCFKGDVYDIASLTCNSIDLQVFESAEFTGGRVLTSDTPSKNGWTFNPSLPTGIIDSYCFFPMYIVGGYEFMSQNTKMSKLYTNLLPHYWVSFRFQIYWIKEIFGYFRIYIDSILELDIDLYSLPTDKYLEGRSCDGNSLNHETLYVNTSHNTSKEVLIYFRNEMTGSYNFYYGVNNFVMHIEQCHYSCLNCSGPSKNQCTLCYINSHLSNGSCVCDTGYVIDPYPEVSTCVAYPCSSCVACSIANCMIYHGCSCFECGIGYFVSLQIDKYICSSCDSNCEQCDVISSNCTACNGGLFLKANSCVSNCGVGFYGTTSNICQECSSTCVECEIVETNCTKCKDGTFLENNQCVLVCLDGFLGDIADNTCKPCYNICKTCEMVSNNCTSCKMNTFLQGNACQDQCSDGFWGSLNENKCYPCDVLCLTCDISAINCTSCPINKFLFGNQCVENCLNGFLADEIDQKCIHCDENCEECSLIATNCTACKNNTFLERNKCKGKCSDGLWGSLIDNKCYFCDESCLTCDQSSTNCTSCKQNSFLNVNKCVTECPNGFWCDEINLMCRECDTICATCSQESTNCTSCKYPKPFFFENTCLSTCPVGYFANQDQKICQKCNIDCKTCDASSFNCTSCEAKFIFTFSSNKTGKCLENSNNELLACETLCKSCENESFNCSSCYGAWILAQNSTSIETYTCVATIQVFANLERNSQNLKVFYLSFSNSTADFEDKINQTEKAFKVSISNLDSSDFSFSIAEKKWIPLSARTNVSIVFKIVLSFTKTLNSSQNLFILFNETFLNGDSILKTPNVSISILIDQNKRFIEPSLKQGSDPAKFILSFSDYFQEFFIMLPDISKITIPGYSQENYNYSINPTSNPLLFDLSLNLKTSLIGKYSLNVTFSNIPEHVLEYKDLTKKTLIIQMKDVYYLGESDKRSIEIANTISSLSNKTSSYTLCIFALLNSGSSLGFFTLLLMNFIKFLKFLDIDYPPNALSVFEARIEIIDLLPQLEIDHEDNPVDGKLEYYSVDNYILNNEGAMITQLILLAFVILLLHLVYGKFQNVLRKAWIFEFLIVKTYEVLRWNFVCSLIIGNMNDFFFFALLNLIFPSCFNDYLNMINFSMSILLIALLILYSVFLYSIISKIVSVLDQQENKQELSFKIGEEEAHFKENQENQGNSPVKNLQYTYNLNSPVIPINRNNDISHEKIDRVQNLPAINKKEDIFEFSPETYKKNQIIPIQKDQSLNALSSTEQENEVNTPNELFKTTGKSSKNKSTFSKGQVRDIKYMQNEEKGKDYMLKFRVLFEDFNHSSKWQSNYLIIDMLKFPIMSSIVLIDRFEPLRQSVLIVVLTFIMLLFLIYVHPFKSKFVFFQNIFQQITLLLCTVSAFILAYLDYVEDYNQEKRLIVGWMIVYGNLGLIYFVSFVMVSNVVMNAFRILKLTVVYIKKRYQASNKVVPFEGL